VKSTSERRRDPPPGVAIGVIDRALRVEEITSRRLFPRRMRLRGWLARCYAGEIPTRCIPGGGASRRLRYAG